MSPEIQRHYGVTDPFDPVQNMIGAQKYAADNGRALRLTLGRDPTDAELYLAHQQGAGGAEKLLFNPDARAGSLVGDFHIRDNGGDPNAPAWMFTNMWTARFNGAPTGWRTALGAPTAFDRPSTRGTAYQMALDDPDLKADPVMAQKTFTHIHQMAVTQEVAEGTNDQQRKQQNEQARDGYVKRSLAHQEPAIKILTDVINDPNLNAETREHLGNALEKKAEQEVNGTTKQYGAGFWNVFDQVTADDDDPRRIRDPVAILKRAGPGGDLNLEGADKLISELRIRDKPEGVAESEMRKQFLLNARKQITGSDDLAGIRDPKGDELYLKFMTYALPAYEAAKAAGKTAQQLLNPDSPDYIGKSISTFRRTPQQMYDDIMNRQEETNKPAAFDPSKIKTLEEAKAAYASGQMNKQQADELAIERGWGFRKPPEPERPQVPTSQ